jgi:hypothetical protein
MDIETLKSMLADLDTASICDADKAVRVMDPDIRPLRACSTCSTTASTKPRSERIRKAG